jgi:FolB domain-containing protein
MKRDRVFLEAFKYNCSIGCTPEERAFPQSVTVDLSVETDFSLLLSTKELGHGIDWAKLDLLFSQTVGGRNWKLAEELADALIRAVLVNFPAALSVAIKVRKFPFPHGEAVGVEMERTKDDL